MAVDYAPPGALDAFTAWGAAFMLLAGMVGAVYAGVRWVGRRWDERVEEIAARLDERTIQIQPGANGGKSLPDAAKEARRARELAETAHDRIGVLELQGVEVLRLVGQLHKQLMSDGPE